MAISGLVGAGAAEGLQDLLARQLQEQMFAEQQRQALEQEQFRRAQMSQQAEQFEGRMGLEQQQLGLEQQQLELQDRSRRDRANQAGVEDMLRQRGMMDEQEARQVQLDQISRVMDDPSVSPSVRRMVQLGVRPSAEMVMTPEERAVLAQEDIGRAGSIAEAQARAAARYREPKTPAAQAAGQTPMQAPYTAERAARTVESVDALMGKISRMTAGIGTLMSGIPESPARNFSAELDTLKANIAFNELTEMRAASKTGGALGQVSERELALLESSLGALDPGQSPENLRAQLQRVKDSILRYQEAKGGGAVALMSSHGGQPPPQTPTGGARFRFNPQTGKVEPIR